MPDGVERTTGAGRVPDGTAAPGPHEGPAGATGAAGAAGAAPLGGDAASALSEASGTAASGTAASVTGAAPRTPRPRRVSGRAAVAGPATGPDELTVTAAYAPAAPARRPRSRLRGWGGVAAMGVACGLTASLALLALPHTADRAGVPVAAPGTGEGVQVTARNGEDARSAETCKDAEASLTPSGADGPSVVKIKQRGKLVVGVDQSSYNWGFRTPPTVTRLPDGSAKETPGELQGFDIDLAKAIAKDILGDENAVIFRTIPTNQRIAALESGKVDLVVRTMTINCKRIQQVAFSTAYFQAGQQVLAPKSSPITGYDSSLSGKRICTAEGSTAYEALEEKSFGAVYKDVGDDTKDDPDLLTVPNQLDCLARLQMGEVDAVVTDNALAAGQAAQDPAVELKGRPFTTEYYGVAAKLGNDDLVRRVNQVLVRYRQGPWQKAYDTWLKADLPGISGPPAPKYKENER